MTQAIKITTATDANAEYVLRKIEEADQCDAAAKTATERGRECRIEAGKRLIEVRSLVVQHSGQAGVRNGWQVWLTENGIAVTTAHRLMQLAGFTEEQRVQHRANEADRKRTERAAKPQQQATPSAPRTYGWIAALSQFTTLREQFGGSQLRTYEKLSGCKVPASMDETEARAFAADFVLVTKRDEPIELPEAYEKKLQRAKDLELARMKREFIAAVKNRSDEETAKTVAHYGEELDKLYAQQHDYELRSQNLKSFMSKEDYDLILYCLHPDHQPEDRKERYGRAFAIMRRMDKYINAKW